MWGVSSCRFIYIDYVSDRGNIETLYMDPTADGDANQYRTGAGLFTWLTPFGDESVWSEGSCIGYAQGLRNHITDNKFEVARIFAVLSVLCGTGMAVWTLFLSCISLGKFQIRLMSVTFFCITCFTGFTFLIFQSGLCNELVTFQGYESQCTMDQGGLVVIAACILWSVAFLITVIYIKSPESEMAFINGQIRNAFDERQAARKRREKERMYAKEVGSPSSRSQPSPQRSSRSHVPISGINMDDGTVELELGRDRRSVRSI
jgi:hypothetical protein